MVEGLFSVLQNFETTWQLFLCFGQIFNAVNGQILKNNRAIRSHCLAQLIISEVYQFVSHPNFRIRTELQQDQSNVDEVIL